MCRCEVALNHTTHGIPLNQAKLQTLLEALNDAWSHPFESLTAALSDLESGEASWQLPGYAQVQALPGTPPPGTILWQLAHLDSYARQYSSILGSGGVSEHLDPASPEESDLQGLLMVLERSHSALRDSIAQLTDEDLSAPCTPDMPVGEFIRMVVRHITWHASQIALTRRLYQLRLETPL